MSRYAYIILSSNPLTGDFILSTKSQDVPEFRVILAGEGGVGKTSFVKRHSTGEFETKYVATLGVEVHPLLFHTTCGPIKFIVSDVIGQEKHGQLRNGYYAGGQCAIMMFDVTSRLTYTRVTSWYRDLIRVCGTIPIVLCGNKVDINERKIMADQMTFIQRNHLQYYDISVKDNYNCKEPFLWLARMLTGDDQLHFVEAPALQPPEVTIDEQTMARNEAELAQAVAQPLPEDNDDDDDDL